MVGRIRSACCFRLAFTFSFCVAYLREDSGLLVVEADTFAGDIATIVRNAHLANIQFFASDLPATGGPSTGQAVWTTMAPISWDAAGRRSGRYQASLIADVEAASTNIEYVPH